MSGKLAIDNLLPTSGAYIPSFSLMEFRHHPYGCLRTRLNPYISSSAVSTHAPVRDQDPAPTPSMGAGDNITSSSAVLVAALNSGISSRT